MQQIGMEKTKRDFHSTKYYVNAVKKETVRTDHPQQRESGQWSAEYRDGLIGTIIKGEDIPYIVICEQITDKGVDNYLIDGIQRVTTIFNYRIGAFKLGKKIENPLIEYQVNVFDENGKPKRDDDGNLIHETKICDIRGKGYKDLPEELQEIFDEYQLMEVKHLNCSDDQIGYHLRRYNHAKKMGASQNGLTYLNKKIAMQVKGITNTHTFFKDQGNFKPSERNNDTLNRVVLESIMATYFLDSWKSSLKDICSFLNDNLNNEMISVFKSELDSLSEVISESVAEMFSSKNSFLWFVTYHKFYELRLDTKKFIAFMEEFKSNLHCKKWHETTFDELNEVSTKKKNSIIKKLQLLEEFMYEFLNINKEDLKEIDVLKFVKENVNSEINNDDIELYNDCLDSMTVELDQNNRLLNKQNKPSLLAVVAYACDEDKDYYMEEWFEKFANNHNTYIVNQKENFKMMKDSFENYLSKMEDA